jgi:hypothetical protein
MTSSDTPLQSPSAAGGTQPLPVQAVASLLGARDQGRLLSAVFLALPLLWVIAYFFPPINQDVGVILSVAERWMSGERLYLDVIDVNPPPVFMLTLVPVAVAKVLPVSAADALMACVVALALWSAWTSYRLLSVLAVVGERTAQFLLLPFLLFILIVFPSEMFAQREHLMAVGMIPYLLLAAARCENKSVAWSLALPIGVIATLGFALKPHFLVIPLAVEAYLLIVRGPRAALRDSMPWLMGGIMVLYALVAWLVTPAYFTFVLPLVMSAYEDIGGTSYFKIITGKELAPYLFVLLPLTIAAFRLRWPHAMRLTGIVGLAAAFEGVAQDKGWPYHLLPAQMAAVLMFGWAVALVMDRLQQSGEAVAHHARSMVGLVLLLIYCFAGASRVALYDQMGYETSQAGQWQRILEKYVSGSSVLMITPGIYPHFPAMNYVQVKQASRFLTVWPLQGAYEGCKPLEPRYHSPDRMTETERLYNRMLIEDLAKNKPQLVVVDEIPGIPWCGGKEFDFVEYFLLQPAFAAEWRNYTYIASYDRYLLYLRQPVADVGLIP